jgi:hypothetical protein
MQTEVQKRKTVNGTTFRIEKEKDKQNYFLTADRQVFDSHRTKREALDYFRDAVQAEKENSKNENSQRGSGGPTIPGFGQMMNDDDDNGPRLPGF